MGQKKGHPAWNKGLPKEQQPMFGKKHSESTKIRISKSETGKRVSKKTRLKIGRGYVKTENRMRQISELGKSQRAEKSPHWISDRTKLAKRQERNDSAYGDWVIQCKKRDKLCKLKNEECDGYLVVHHIKPWRDYPELRYELLNGITLCQFHHPRKRADEQRLIPVFIKLVGLNIN